MCWKRECINGVYSLFLSFMFPPFLISNSKICFRFMEGDAAAQCWNKSRHNVITCRMQASHWKIFQYVNTNNCPRDAIMFIPIQRTRHFLLLSKKHNYSHIYPGDMTSPTPVQETQQFPHLFKRHKILTPVQKTWKFYTCPRDAAIPTSVQQTQQFPHLSKIWQLPQPSNTDSNSHMYPGDTAILTPVQETAISTPMQETTIPTSIQDSNSHTCAIDTATPTPD